jgi:hypothetical protein
MAMIGRLIDKLAALLTCESDADEMEAMDREECLRCAGLSTDS